MSLRRPPTRVELKTDDIDEYTQIMKEREMAMETSNTTTTHTPRHGISARRGGNVSSAQERKQAAAERIGIGYQRG